jgi:hypothetical protein
VLAETGYFVSDHSFVISLMCGVIVSVITLHTYRKAFRSGSKHPNIRAFSTFTVCIVVIFVVLIVFSFVYGFVHG